MLDVILPSPLNVGKALYKIIVDGTLKIDILTSLRRIATGYFCGVIIAIILGVGSGLNRISTGFINNNQ